jgi:hypothetical protein
VTGGSPAQSGRDRSVNPARPFRAAYEKPPLQTRRRAVMPDAYHDPFGPFGARQVACGGTRSHGRNYFGARLDEILILESIPKTLLQRKNVEITIPRQ